jgi:hypothetical protein
MQARDLFGVALRILGVWFFIQAGADLIFLLLRLNNVLEKVSTQTTQDKFFVAFYLAVAMVAIGMADHIVRLVYGPVPTASIREQERVS